MCLRCLILLQLLLSFHRNILGEIAPALFLVVFARQPACKYTQQWSSATWRQIPQNNTASSAVDSGQLGFCVAPFKRANQLSCARSWMQLERHDVLCGRYIWLMMRRRICLWFIIIIIQGQWRCKSTRAITQKHNQDAFCLMSALRTQMLAQCIRVFGFNYLWKVRLDLGNSSYSVILKKTTTY